MFRLRRNMVAILATGFCLGIQVALFLTEDISILHLLVILLSGYFLTWALYALLSATAHAELMNRFSLMTSSLVLCLVVAEGVAMVGLVDYRAIFGSFEPGNALSVRGRHADQELLWRRTREI